MENRYWTCKSCGNMNFDTDEKCYRCGKDRYKEEDDEDGDNKSYCEEEHKKVNGGMWYKVCKAVMFALIASGIICIELIVDNVIPSLGDFIAQNKVPEEYKIQNEYLRVVNVDYVVDIFDSKIKFARVSQSWDVSSRKDGSEYQTFYFWITDSKLVDACKGREKVNIKIDKYLIKTKRFGPLRNEYIVTDVSN